MAGASFLVLSFLAGIVVGRGVDAHADTPVTRLAHEDKVITEEPPPSAKTSAPASAELGYARAVELDKPVHQLEPKGQGLPPIIAVPPGQAGTTTRTAGRETKTATSSPKPAASAAPAAPASGQFAIQVGAFKDRASADSLVGRLRSKGYSAYAEGNSGGLFNVRVGSFPAREAAEKVEARLRDQEKFKPFIVRQ
jgi:DedD protein